MTQFLRRLSRPTVAFIHDMVMAALSFILSLYLRVGPGFGDYDLEFLVAGAAAFTAIAGIVYLWMDLYRGIWRYASLNDLLAIARAVALIILVFLPVHVPDHAAGRPAAFGRRHQLVRPDRSCSPRPRILYRLLKDGRFDLSFDRAQDQRIPVLLIGAGAGAEMFIQAMGRRTRSELPRRRHSRRARSGGSAGISTASPVMGTVDDLAAVVRKLGSAARDVRSAWSSRARSGPATGCAAWSTRPASSA